MSKQNISRARILQQLKNMQKDKTDYLHAQPLQTDLYTWHFTFRGPENTDFHEGLYHGQILLPFDYPFKPPDIIFANKNGRFQVNTKICLTITQYHTEEWNSAWTIRTMIEAVISLFNQRVVGHGYLESSSEARRFFAKASHDYTCEKCGKISDILKPRQPISKKKQQIVKPQIKKQDQPQQTMAYRTLQQKQQETNSQQKYKQKTIVKNEDNLKQKQKRSQERLNYKKQNKTQKAGNVKQQRRSNKIKKYQPHQLFYNALLQGNQEYLAVIKSKKFVQE